MLDNILQAQTFINAHPTLFIALMVWSVAWKGLALWKSARLSHKRWFISLLIFNTAGILDIIYLYFVAKKYTVVSETE